MKVWNVAMAVCEAVAAETPEEAEAILHDHLRKNGYNVYEGSFYGTFECEDGEKPSLVVQP